MTKREIECYFAGLYVLTASQNTPINLGLLHAYLKGAMAAYEYLTPNEAKPEVRPFTPEEIQVVADALAAT